MEITEDHLFRNGIAGLRGAGPYSFIAQYLIA